MAVTSGFQQQDAVLPELLIPCDQGQPFQARLRFQHSIERVGVVKRQSGSFEPVTRGDWQFLKVLFGYVEHPLRVERELTFGPLDRQLPKLTPLKYTSLSGSSIAANTGP